MTEPDAGMMKQLQQESDDAYCRSLDIYKTPPCLGWEAKVRAGMFGHPEMEAHKAAAVEYGKHLGLQMAIAALASRPPQGVCKYPACGGLPSCGNDVRGAEPCPKSPCSPGGAT